MRKTAQPRAQRSEGSQVVIASQTQVTFRHCKTLIQFRDIAMISVSVVDFFCRGFGHLVFGLRPQISSSVMSRSIDKSEAAELDVPSFREFNQKGNDVDSTNMSAKIPLEREDVDSSSHFVYNELKVTSDTELEGHVDDKKDSMALVLDTRYSQETTVEESVEIEPE
ncbi:hypothetical protein AKJ16_DCAP27665, partial [Drosera capensis]